MTSISLSDLTNSIQETIKLNFSVPVWIHAEISELRENPNGHCYLELIEKDSDTDNLLAKSKATIWSSTYRMLKPYFEGSTGQVLRSGLTVLVAVTVEFHGVYGFNLNVKDIDPTYTIGEMAARRLKIIRQLEEDGIAEMNKELPLPLIPQRLAIISSPTAAGYGDFMNQLNANRNNYTFYSKLFPSVMQGEQAESSIISALEKVYNHIHLFDVVVIIRGGGATTDLACFDSYELALNCAQFPLPIISGIGHQRDVSILDMIAHTSVKTPTAAAEFLTEQLNKAETATLNAWYGIYNYTSGRISTDKQRIQNLKWLIRQNLQNKVGRKQSELIKSVNRLKSATKNIIVQQQNHLLLLDKSIEVHSPEFLVKHGYTITTLNGKRLTSAKKVKKGETIKTFLPDGHIDSEVI